MLIYVYGAIFVAASALCFWYGLEGAPEEYFPMGIFAAAVAAGLFLKKRWTEAALFGVGLYIVLGWLIMLIYFADAWPEATILARAISFIPSLAYCVFWIAMWWLVRKYFQSTREATS